MRALPAALALVAVASLSGCGAGEATLSLSVDIKNESASCGPQATGEYGDLCYLEFESGVATLIDPETGDELATSDLFVQGPGIAPDFWRADFEPIELPADQEYEISVPGCDEVKSIDLDADDEGEQQYVRWEVDENGECE